jgi:hypothetical protein
MTIGKLIVTLTLIFSTMIKSQLMKLVPLEISLIPVIFKSKHMMKMRMLITALLMSLKLLIGGIQIYQLIILLMNYLTNTMGYIPL